MLDKHQHGKKGDLKMNQTLKLLLEESNYLRGRIEFGDKFWKTLNRMATILDSLYEILKE